jgi:hypothetical protein
MIARIVEGKSGPTEQSIFLGRFGFVAFGPIGRVADSFKDFDSSELLPAGGATSASG